MRTIIAKKYSLVGYLENDSRMNEIPDSGYGGHRTQQGDESRQYF